ncbi:MAG TPA: LysR substrate-binding domain-containing protein [Acetobacteraceae bacterium]|jgi:LysR family hydrogen peroxide-inducible transcriptional activator
MTPLPTPQQLRYLLALAEHQHFGRAADACAVTQSTLSAGILALERQLDVHILDRSNGRRVAFTTLGCELVTRARTAMAALSAVLEAADAARAPMSGPMRVGMIPTVSPFLLPRMMPAMRAAFPRLRLFLREDTTERLMDRLRAGTLDVAVVALPCDCAGAESAVFARDMFLAAVPQGHALAGRDSVPVASLAAERLLLLEDGHCLRDQTLTACGVIRTSLGRTSPAGEGDTSDEFAATSLYTLVQMVAGGLGVALLPRLALEAGIAEGAGIAIRPLADPGAWRGLALAWRAESPRAAEYRAMAPVLAQASEARGASGGNEPMAGMRFATPVATEGEMIETGIGPER